MNFSSIIEDDDLLLLQLSSNVKDQYVVFNVGSNEYALPILKVQEIVALPEFTRIPGAADYIPGIIHIRGIIIPLYIIHPDVETVKQNLHSKSLVIIITLDNKKSIGIIVDTVRDVLTLEEELVHDVPEMATEIDISYINKIARFEKGNVFVLDIDAFIKDSDLLFIEGAAQHEV